MPPGAGTVRYHNIKFVENRHGKPVAINRNGAIVIQDREGRERERYTVVYGAVLDVRNGDVVEGGHEARRVGSVHLRDSHRRQRDGEASTTSSPASR